MDFLANDQPDYRRRYAMALPEHYVLARKSHALIQSDALTAGCYEARCQGP
jgi:hypothetical protein